MTTRACVLESILGVYLSPHSTAGYRVWSSCLSQSPNILPKCYFWWAAAKAAFSAKQIAFLGGSISFLVMGVQGTTVPCRSQTYCKVLIQPPNFSMPHRKDTHLFISPFSRMSRLSVANTWGGLMEQAGTWKREGDSSPRKESHHNSSPTDCWLCGEELGICHVASLSFHIKSESQTSL